MLGTFRQLKSNVAFHIPLQRSWRCPKEAGMVMRMGSTTMVLIGVIALVLAASDPGQALGADKEKPAKKPKAAPEAKAPKSKADKSKFKTAETAAKAKACFGEAPK